MAPISCDKDDYKSKVPRQPPPPIVSLGRIIGYKIASLDIVTKTMDLFNETIYTKITRQRSKRTDEQGAGTACNGRQRTVPSEKIFDDTNLNATQDKEGDKGNPYRKIERRKRFTLRDKKTVAREISKRTSCSKQRNPRLKNRTNKDRDQGVDIGNRIELRPRVKPPIHKLDPEVDESAESTSQQCLENSHARTTCGQIPGKTVDKNHLTETRLRTSNRKVPVVKSSSTNNVQPNNQSDRTDKKVETNVDSNSAEVSDESTSQEIGNKESSPSDQTVRDSKTTSVIKKNSKLRWADVVAGTSKVDDCGQPRDDNLPIESVDEDKGTDATDSSASTYSEMLQVSAAEEKTKSPCSHSKNAKTSKKGKNRCKVANVSEKADQSITSTVLAVPGPGSYPENFPSLEEQKRNKTKKEKYSLRLNEMNQDSSTKSWGKHNKRRLQGNTNLPGVSNSRRRGTMKSNKTSKVHGKSGKGREKLNNAELTVATKLERTSNDSWYFIDDIQEVFIQPVGKICTLQEREKDVHNGSTGECSTSHLTVYAVDSVRRNEPSGSNQPEEMGGMDICRQLNAMSVCGNAMGTDTLGTIASTSKSKKRAKKRKQASRFTKPKSRSQKDTQKNVMLDEPGSPTKKVSAKYRALLRKDHGKVDAKTATEIFNCGRWMETHQKDKMYDRFDSHQQRRNQTKKNDPTQHENITGEGEVPAQSSGSNDTLYYCLPQQQNGCPTM